MFLNKFRSCFSNHTFDTKTNLEMPKSNNNNKGCATFGSTPQNQTFEWSKANFVLDIAITRPTRFLKLISLILIFVFSATVESSID